MSDAIPSRAAKKLGPGLVPPDGPPAPDPPLARRSQSSLSRDLADLYVEAAVGPDGQKYPFYAEWCLCQASRMQRFAEGKG